ncbi:MAG: hypothetical protein P4L50_23705 [Anaerolineaceae bacterium]|nr:hypothetical protein [Anaerolineaceae bacterium]
MEDKPESFMEQLRELKWPMEDDLPLLYANQFALYETQFEIVLVFGDFFPIGFPNRPQEEFEQFLKNTTVKPIAKIAMSKGAFKLFSDLLIQRIQDQAKTNTVENGPEKG